MTYSVDSVVCDYGVYENVNGNRNCGTEVYVKETEINTVRPKIEIPEKDERRGH